MMGKQRKFISMVLLLIVLTYLLAATLIVYNPDTDSDVGALPTIVNLPTLAVESSEVLHESDPSIPDNSPSEISYHTPDSTQSISDTSTISLEQIPDVVADYWQEPEVIKTMLYDAEPAVIAIPETPVRGQMVLRFSPDASPAERHAYIQSIGGTIIQSLDQLNTITVIVPEDVQLGNLSESPLVLNSEPDYYVSALVSVPTSDTRYAEQWALSVIHASDGWLTMPPDTPSVNVAVIDSGICSDHPDLTGRIHSSWDFIDNDVLAQDEYGHGCAVSGIIAANIDNGIGIAGIAPNTQVMALRVLDAKGVGVYSNVAAAIVYAVDHNAQIINLSLGGLFPSAVMEAAVNYALSRGVTVIAAAGNTGSTTMTYPAAYPGVISVGSVDPNLLTSSFSSNHPDIDLMAPGRDIVVTTTDNSYTLMSGTSFAAPQVAGIAALKMAFQQTLVLHGGIVSFTDRSTTPDNNPTPEPTPPVPATFTRIDTEVLDLLHNTGRAKVIIALNDPTAMSASIEELSQAVAQAQNDILTALSVTDFVLAHQYHLVPALAGEISVSALSVLESSPNVALVYLDKETTSFDFESMPLIGAPSVHRIYGLTGEGITVAVLDSGLDLSNPAIVDDVIAQHCFSDSLNPTCPGDIPGQYPVAESSNASIQNPDMQHGTNVTAIITAPGGVAPDASIVAIRVLDDHGSGNSSDYIAGLDWILRNNQELGVDVVNMSLGSLDLYLPGNATTYSCDSKQRAEALAINMLVARGIPVFVATGNQGNKQAISSPACTSGAISVAATYDSNLGREPDLDGTTFRTEAGMVWGNCYDATTSPTTVTCFSNVNNWTDLAAPGANIVIANTGFAGTSQAAPHAAGAAALLLQQKPDLLPSQVEILLEDTGTLVTDTANNVRLPRINVQTAIAWLVGNPLENLCDPITQIPRTECEALLAVYRSTNGPNWENKAGWYSAFGNGLVASGAPITQPCNGWANLSCNATNTNIRQLYLNGVTGSIPRELGNLSRLEYLSITSGVLSGGIPTELGNLTQLQRLYLSGNQLTGTIPASLGNLTQLQRFSLAVNQLSGTIPESLGNLTQLLELDLSLNQITGVIPATLSNLTQLRILRLNNNLLSGTVPAALGNLTNLMEFPLNNNQITGLPDEIDQLTKLTLLLVHNNRISTLPDTLRNLTGLTSLYAHDNQITSIQPGIGQLTNLRSLSLSNNRIESISSELGQLTNLTALEMGNNRLSGEIPPELGNLTNLESLSLYNNQLSGEIPPELGNLSNLQMLRLYNNQLSGSIPDELGNLSNLRYLHLELNLLSGDIPATFTQARFPYLSSLTLHLNSLNRPPAGSPQEALVLAKNRNAWPTQLIPTSITASQSNTPNTTTITWSAPFLSGYAVMESGYILEIVRQSDQSIATITYLPSPQFLPVNTAIQGLDANTTYEARMRAYVRTNLNYLVGINNLSATFSTRESLCTGRITQIPMEECQALEAIYFSLGGPNWSGNWTGQFSNRWYEAFGNGYTVPTWAYSQPCDGWKGVTCDANKATVIGIGGLDSLVGIIPSQVGDLSNLQSLNLHGGNNLTGTIPSELGNLSDLRYLAIYGQLTGSIPASLGNLTNLTNLRLGNNQLSGALPPELGSLQSLQYLELSKNLINASIPPEIWNLRQLQYLNLSQNQLSGSIPPELGNLTNLVTLELYSNNLTGQIPAEIGYLSQLRDLKLAWNQLSGTIPANLGNLQNLQSLVLRTNQLSGPIPPELGNLENLTMLSLSQNQLGGSIPVELGNLENLVNLSLDQNSLVGSIPSTIGNLSNLQSLNLSYNQLTGSIPYQLGSIHSLDSLRLDHNQLSGQIPSSLGNLTNLIQFNLSTNSLTGEIPSSLANLTNLTFGLYLGNNGLWTYNTALQNFITSYDTYAFTSQTIPPSNITIIDRYLDGFSLRWTPIPYSGSGYYQVSCSPNSGGPYAPAGDISTTLNKSTTGITIRGLEPGSTQFCVVTTTSLNMTSVPSPEFSVNVGALAGSTNYVPAYPDLVNPITSPDETFIIYADLLVPGEFDDLAACDITSDAGRSVIFQGSPSVFGVTSGVGRSVIFSTEGSTVDTVISVYFLDEGSALSPEQLRQVACNDDSEGSSSSWVELKIIDGVLYDADGNSIQMDADDLLVIVVEIRGTPSADDKVLLNIDTQPFESVTDTSEPTQIEDPNTVYMIPIVLADDSEFDDLSSCDITGNAGRSVIFQGSPAIFGATAGVGRSVIFSTEGSTLDTVVSVYLLQGGDPIAPEYLIPLACNDNAAADGSSAVMLKIIDGIAYDANGNPYVLGPDDQIVVIIEVREPVDLNDLAILDIITSMLVAVEDTSSPTSIEPDTVYTVPADLLTANVYDSLATCDLTQDGGRSVIFQGSSAIFGDTVGGGRSVIFSTEGSTADTILSAYYLEGGALLSPETLQLLACNDDFGTLLTSLVKLNMIDGVLYDANGDTISFTPDDLLIVIVEIRGEVDSTDLVVLSVESQAFVLISDPSQVTSIEPDTVYTVPADLLTTSMYDYLATCDLTQDGGRSVIFQGSSAIFGDTVGGGRSVIFSTEGSTADTILSVYYLEGGALLSPETLQLLACNDDFGTLLTSLVKVNMIDGVLYDANGDTISFTPDDLLIVIVEIRGEVSSSDDLLLSVETEPLQMIAETTPITDITEPDIVYISRPEYTSLNPEFDGKSSCDPTQDGGRSVIFQGSVDLLSSTNVGGRSVIFSDTRNSSMDTVLTMYYLDGSLSFAYDNMVEVTCNDNNFDQRTSFVQAVLKGNQLTLSDGTMLTVTPDDSIILVAQTRGNPTLSDELRVRIGHLDQTFDPNVATVLTQPNSIYITQPLFVDPKPPLDGTASCDTSSNAGESVVFRAGIGVFGNTDADNRSIIFSSTEGSSLDTVLVMYLHRGTSTMPLDVGNLVEISCSDDSSQNVRDIGGPGTETVVTEGNLQPPPGSLALTSFTSAVFQDGILYTQDGRAITTSPDDELIIVAQTRGTATVEDKLRILIGTELVDPMIQVSRAEAFALSAIYDSTDGDQWTNTLNNDRVWFVTAEPCGRDGIPAWYGITCDMNHRIIALDLANNGLQGPIPPQISYLLSLSRLTIQNNMLIGEIPGTITTLTQLGSLDIDYNALTASGTTATYINRLDPNGLATQTIAPKNVQMGSLTDNSALLSWTPIQFTAFDGGYQAFCSTQSGGPYVASGIVANKTSTQMTVSGLVAGTTYYCVVGSYTLPHGEQINTLNSLYSLEVAATTSLPLGLSKVAGSQNTFEFDGTTQFPFIFRANSQHLPRGDAFTSSCTPDGTVPVRGHSVIFRGTSNVFGDPTGGLSVLIGQADKNSCITILSESNGIFSELASTASSVTAYASEGEVVAQAEILGDRMYYIQYVVMTEGDIVLTTDVRSNFEPAVTTLADITVPEDSDPTSIDVYAIFNDVEDADAQLTYTIVHTNPQLVTISELDPLTGNIVLSYATNQYGEDFVTIRATDSTGLFGETTINVTVEAVNDAPTARTIDPITVTENDPATFSDLSQVFTDVEDEPAALLVAVDSNTNPNLFDAIAIDPVTHLMTVDFAPNRYGEADITLSATDSGGLSVEVIVQITVQPLRTTGSITIAVDAIPDSGRDWNFSGSLGNFTLDDDDTFADASPIFHRLYFADLLPGTYSIAELNIVEPNSWGLDNISCQLMDNNPAVAFRTETASVTIELSAGQDITCVFTNRRLGSLIVTTFNDLNGDGVLQNKEPLMAGIPIQVYSLNNPSQLVAYLNTDQLGRARFSGLLVGLYSVCEILPDGWISSSTSVEGSCQIVEILPGKTVRAFYGNISGDLGALSAAEGPQIVESDTALVSQFGLWELMNDRSDASNGTYLRSTGPDTALLLQFSGTSAEVEYLGGPHFGDFVVEIDGILSVTGYGTMEDDTSGLSIIIDNLPNGVHLMRVRPLSTLPVAIDTFVIVVPEMVESTPTSVTPTGTDSAITATATEPITTETEVPVTPTSEPSLSAEPTATIPATFESSPTSEPTVEGTATTNLAPLPTVAPSQPVSDTQVPTDMPAPSPTGAGS